MKVLVIPDVHLKPWMFKRASELMKENQADRAVCLMDIADDWRQQFNLNLYEETYDAAIAFAREYPETLWCYGNHDLCYLWNQRETGYSKIAPRTVCEKLRVLRESLPDEHQLETYLDLAQAKMGTNIPVTLLDKQLHQEPSSFREKLIEAEKNLPTDVDTVLVAMGFCGGAWDQVTLSRRAVIPRVADCAAMMLQTDDSYRPNPKETGHLYMMEIDPDDFNMNKVMEDRSPEYSAFSEEQLFQMLFGSYSSLDIIDTGCTDCYDLAYAEKAQKYADSMHVALDYVPGSNRILEKLVSGKWDEQFLLAEAGHVIKHSDFFG